VTTRAQIDCTGFFDESVSAIVVHHGPSEAETEASAAPGNQSLSLQSHPLAWLERGAGQVHFKLLHPGRILENRAALAGICPPDISFQTKLTGVIWTLGVPGADRRGIG
jgi:hypothetical protein